MKLATIDDLIRQSHLLAVQAGNLAKDLATLRVEPTPTPTPNNPIVPPRPAGPNTGGAANHLANILNGGSHVIPPHAPPQPILPPEVMARYAADQKAYAEAFRSLGPMGSFHLHLTPPNLNNYKNDHAYIWPGHALIASHPGGNNPRAL